MTKHQELKNIVGARLGTIDILINGKDFSTASYMMAHSLECALKAVACKTLHLSAYPPTSSKKIESFFKTHYFDTLLIVSGMTDVFGSNGDSYKEWSGFTKDFLGDWVAMRYNEDDEWDEEKAKNLHNLLNRLLDVIKERW